MHDCKTPGLASRALGVEDLTSDPGGSGFCWAIINVHTRLWTAMRPHRRGNEVVFKGEGVREEQGRQPRAPGNSEMTSVKLMSLSYSMTVQFTVHAEEKGCACLHSSPTNGSEEAEDPRPIPLHSELGYCVQARVLPGPETELGQKAHQGPHSPSRTVSRARGTP